MALPADILLQAWRPSAYVIIGTINWLSVFVIGMLFGYIVVRHQQRIYILPKVLYLLMKLSVFLFSCTHTEGTRTVLLPVFCGLHPFQWRLRDIFCARDQRKDDGRDHRGV